jgi:hypothetical protein
MNRRGVNASEVDETFERGWPCGDARSGVECRTRVFVYDAEWEGRWYAEKEVTVYFKYDDGELVWITAKARYGSGFPRGGAQA